MKTLIRTISAILSILLFHTTQASNIAEEMATKTASKFCTNPVLKKTGLKSSSLLRSADVADTSYYVFANESNNFCIISGNGNRVLGYGNNYAEEMPSQLQAILDAYSSTYPHKPELRSANIRENIPYFMNVEFGHRSPYNLFVPLRDGKDCPTGCVPTALAQILKYYEYPSKLLNDIPEYSHYSKFYADSIYKIDEQKAENRIYDWSLILNHYDGDTTEALNNEIAKVMIDCGKSVEAKYEQKATSAISEMFYYSLVHYFGYNSDSLKKLSRENYYREEWLDIIHEELSKKRPIYMSATSYENGGHAFICDGYMDGYLHINWGWNGDDNGYFDVDILDYHLNAESNQYFPQYGYSFFQQIIIGIEPGIGNTIVPKPEPSSLVIRTSVVDPDTTGSTTPFIDLTKIKSVGYYSDSSILLRTNIETEKLRDSTNNLALAIIVDGDTIMSEINTDYATVGNNTLSTQNKFNLSIMDKEMKMVVMQSKEFDTSNSLNISDWTLYENFQSTTLKLSDITIFSTELVVDTIIHSYDSIMHKFDIVFSNPTDFEYYDEVYFVIDQYVTGLMIDIPAGGKVGRHIEHQIPVTTNYIQGGFGIMTNHMTKQMIFVKDTFSHVFCQLRAENETQLSLQVYNATSKDYADTYSLFLGKDTISSQSTVIKSDDVIKFNFNLPVITSDSGVLRIDYMKYIAYNNDNNQIGSVIPINYCGTISQEFIEHEKYINIDLKANDLEKANGITIGVTSTLDNAAKYERKKFKATDATGVLIGSIKYNDYFRSKNPKYIGLCKDDGTFYAYMELEWSESNSSTNIPSKTNLTIIASKNGFWVSSDVDIPNLPIYSANGNLVKTVRIESDRTTFVQIPSGIYVVGSHKFLVK